MKTKTLLSVIILLVAALLLAACGSPAGQSGNDPTVVPVVQDFGVMAEGRLVPRESVQMSFVTGGQVAEILVAEGALVKSGDVIARLGNREPLDANLAAAELALLSAQLELSGARMELLNAQKMRADLDENWPTLLTQAQQELIDARQSVHDSQRALNYKTSSAPQFDIDVAWSQVVLAQDALEDAEEKFEPYQNKPEDNLVRANYQSKLAQAQKAYDAAVRNYNAAKGTANEFDITQAEASFDTAQARLEQAQKNYNDLVDGPAHDDVALADAGVEAAQARLAAAEGRVTSAQRDIAAAQAALADMDLVAPLDGAMVNLDLIVGEQVSPGVPVAVVADFSQWFVETDNLTEIEVVNIAENQAVSIVPDALPDVVLTGNVERVEDLFEEKRGDITYTTRIRVDEADPHLRWGMTVVVTFQD